MVQPLPGFFIECIIIGFIAACIRSFFTLMYPPKELPHLRGNPLEKRPKTDPELTRLPAGAAALRRRNLRERAMAEDEAPTDDRE
mmetsp:Transcript_8960/g.29464  ORF Transcript_8960/g.29464 Transcript_8960/m.29464 type:complete len:85 (+) Transcript_8960:165-419(+)